VKKEKNIMSDLISKMQKVANQLDLHNHFSEANYVTELMVKIAQKDYSYLPINVQKAIQDEISKSKKEKHKITPEEIQRNVDSLKKDPKSPYSQISETFSGGENGKVYNYTDEQIASSRAGLSPEQMNLKNEINLGNYDFGGAAKVKPLTFNSDFFYNKALIDQNFPEKVPVEFYNANADKIKDLEQLINTNFSNSKVWFNKNVNVNDGTKKRFFINVLSAFLGTKVPYPLRFGADKQTADYKTQFKYDANELKQIIYNWSYKAIKSELCKLVVESVDQLKNQGRIDTNTTFLGMSNKQTVDFQIETLIKQIENMFTNDPEMLKDNPQAFEEKGRKDYADKLNENTLKTQKTINKNIENLKKEEEESKSNGRWGFG